jgi:hypothetical protein
MLWIKFSVYLDQRLSWKFAEYLVTTIESKSHEDGSESEGFPVINVDVHADFVEPKLFDLKV